MDRAPEIEVRGQRGEIISVMIHVVAIGRLARTSMPAPIMRDDAIAMVQEKHHLRVPVIRSERPAVRKHNRLSFTPVLVENLCAVLRRDRAHGLSSFSGMGDGCSVGLFGRCERCLFALTDVVWRARVSGMYPRCGDTSQLTRTDLESGISIFAIHCSFPFPASGMV